MKINPTNPTDPISAYKTSQIKKANVNDGFEINDNGFVKQRKNIFKGNQGNQGYR